MKRLSNGRAFLALACLACVPGARGDDDKAEKGQVKIGEHRMKLDSGKLYMVRVDAEGFQPQVLIRPANVIFTQSQVSEKDVFQVYFMPKEQREYRILVAPNAYDEDISSGLMDYTLSVKPIPLAEKPLLEAKTELTADDPMYKSADGFQTKSHFKSYKLKMKAKQFYVIDLIKVSNIDPYLYLEDANGKIVTSDDDGGGFPNARIIFQPRREGEYRIIASSLGTATGQMALTVRTQAK